MRVSKKAGEKVAREPLDPWFGDKNDPESLTWQMYAKTCQHLLAKYLASFLTGKGILSFIELSSVDYTAHHIQCLY